ncbi:MAG: glycosyltransferase [Bacteroidetes bacterium]|nr:glycosyltransferase [Bacteroidota bacterium]
MQQNKLHIVSFDVPYPADYGGAIDVYYKIKALKEVGTEIYLHCFDYGRGERKELNDLCKEVWYYPRKTGIAGLSLTLPYITYSRRNEELLRRLLAIDAPVLFEGVHTTYYLSHPSLANRKKIVRTHNVEHEYYRELSIKEKNFIRRFFFAHEAAMLHSYERLMPADCFLSLSMEDNHFFKTIYPDKETLFVGPFHPYAEITSKTGKGEYCLYHGNLSHPENNEAALFLLQHIFPHVDMPFIIAGKNPSKEVISACNRLKNCRLIVNPASEPMQQLIADAHIHILPTFQASGMKLKLLYALFNGRHLVVNDNMLFGTGLQELCNIANNAEAFVNSINKLKNTPFTNEVIEKRKKLLSQQYDNKTNAEKILTSLQG